MSDNNKNDETVVILLILEFKVSCQESCYAFRCLVCLSV